MQHSMRGFGELTSPFHKCYRLLDCDERRLGRGLANALERGALRTDGLIRILSDGGLLRVPLDELEVYLVFGLSSQSLTAMSGLEIAKDLYQARDYFGPLSRTYTFWEALGIFLEDRFGLIEGKSKQHIEDFLDEFSLVVESEASISRKIREIMFLADSLTLTFGSEDSEREECREVMQELNPDIFSIVLRLLILYGNYCHFRMD